MTDLQQRVVLVTGGSAGIGRSTVRRLAAGGARVVTCARHGDRLEEAVGAIPGVTTTVADVADAADRAALIVRTLSEHGRIDAVVHNAGLAWAGLVEDMPREVVEGIVATNLTAVVELTRLALPHLLATAADRGRADVVAVSSVAAWAQVPPLSVYSATKAGVDGFLNGLRREVGARGVRISSVNPFFVRTEWLARGHGHPPESDADAEGRLSRGISPDRVAERIAGCLAASRARTVGVPRWSGLARLGEVPPVNRVLDAVLSRRIDTVRRVTERVVSRRIG